MLVSSPTASGKTEAVCAPLIERNLGREGSWIILYIVPTRALINDLYNRLYQPCELIGIKAAKRTGEYKISQKSKPPNIILTTPESFDSMICRERHNSVHLFYNIVAVVLDEIHLLDGTPRGEQVKWLIHRLNRMLAQGKEKGYSKVEKPQIVGLSATITSLENVCKKYLGHDGRVITTCGSREIEIIGTPWNNTNTEQTLTDYLCGDQEDEKILVFCNQRKRVDELSSDMKQPLKTLGYDTYSHHGSLSKPIRERAEKKMKESGKCVLFATTTLEIGIDIGDIDFVVLDEPAYDISGLLQRIGRGNRRTQKTRVMPCTTSDLGSLIHDSMIRVAEEGWLGLDTNGPQSGVSIQQIMS